MRAPFRHRCLDFIIYLNIRDPSPQDESRGLKPVEKSRDRDLVSHPGLEASLGLFWTGPRSDKKNSCSVFPSFTHLKWALLPRGCMWSHDPNWEACGHAACGLTRRTGLGPHVSPQILPHVLTKALGPAARWWAISGDPILSCRSSIFFFSRAPTHIPIITPLSKLTLPLPIKFILQVHKTDDPEAAGLGWL